MTGWTLECGVGENNLGECGNLVNVVHTDDPRAVIACQRDPTILAEITELKDHSIIEGKG